jgi:hypothetical protein
MSTRFGVLGALACLPAFAQVALSQDPSASQAPSAKIARRQLGPIRNLRESTGGTAASDNWSGYAVLGSSFTSAKASWIVPSAVCKIGSGEEYSAFWVGLDGYSSGTVEQTGTLSDCLGPFPVYYAWYEFYPNPMYEVPVLIAPGNVMSASVVYNGSEFTVTITNVSTGQSYTTSSTVAGAARSSAEWITEAPCCTSSGGILPFSDFGTVDFGADYTSQTGTNSATDSTNSGTIGSFGSANIEQITKVASTTSPQISTCSILSSDGTSFTCTYAP